MMTTTTETSNATLTAVQLRAAWRMAAAYGHEWAQHVAPRPDDGSDRIYPNPYGDEMIAVDLDPQGRVYVQAPIAPAEIEAIVLRRLGVPEDEIALTAELLERRRQHVFTDAYGDYHEASLYQAGLALSEHCREHNQIGAGITAPVTDTWQLVHGSVEPVFVEHTSTTGRTWWQVAPDGTIHVRISRPGPSPDLAWTVLRAAVTASAVTIEQITDDVPTYRRHGAALAVALHAATGLRWEDVAAEIAAAGLTVSPDEPKEEEELS